MGYASQDRVKIGVIYIKVVDPNMVLSFFRAFDMTWRGYFG